MASTSGQIRSTKTYLWYLQDVLGTGATSTVYKGRHKKTGELVAAKAFNSMSFMRPQSVQQREFDVLLKLSHRNIVKLFDIEQDQISKNPVIIMELCTGGSLYNLLDDPRNSYGLEEEEFKRALGDVCAGMKHLRDLDIVHRDIKPGNIMIVTDDCGDTVYKLADFGAARELQDDENFMSLYGTEEYLHPDLYERAVLRQPTGKTFSARIDLWSIGVTFYHVATGVLPFRPYGGRRNRETMFQITTKKKSGVISGVQKDSMNGPIEWSSELPNTCRLSCGLKILLTKILRGLLECNPEKMWTFNRFFDEVQSLLAMKAVDVFHASQSECLKIYVEPRGTLAEFQEAVAEQTGMQASAQGLVWDQDCFVPDASLKCESYPETSPQSPLILLELGRNDFPPVSMPSQPKLPKMTSTYDLDKDFSMSKMCVAVLYYKLAWLKTLTYMQELMTTVSKAIVSVLKAEIKQLDYHCMKLRSSIVEVDTRLLSIEKTLPSPLVSSAVFSRMPLSSVLCTRLQDHQDKVTLLRQKSARMFDEYDRTKNLLQTLWKDIIDGDLLTAKWKPAEKPCHTCVKRFAYFTEDASKIYVQFKKDKQKKHLSYNEEQIHKMDKEKLSLKSTQAISMCQSHCEMVWKKIHGELGEWYKFAYQVRAQISSVDKTLSQLVPNYQTLLQEVHMLDQAVQPPVMEFEDTLQDSLLSLSTTPKVPRSTANKFTNTDQLPPPSGPVPSSPNLVHEVDAMDIASLSDQLASLPIDSNGCILVPRELKELLEAWERDIDQTNEELERGLQKMPLPFANKSSAGLPTNSSNYWTLYGNGQQLPGDGVNQFGSQSPSAKIASDTSPRPPREGACGDLLADPLGRLRYMPEPSQRLSDEATPQFNGGEPATGSFQFMPEPSQRLLLEGSGQFSIRAPVSTEYKFMPEPSQRLSNEGASQFSSPSPQMANGQLH
ncbi:serine/threonine-protein kinase TBK1-like [Acanthaster planci]|uniref:IkappaB kinase n=1 Tax=Acanthaster planci TaxID=133434 RepID=A0A8B7XLI9_ACAPL|nr:serine/threonine-protein kinase TBK1-like [Acanthaster planci]